METTSFKLQLLKTVFLALMLLASESCAPRAYGSHTWEHVAQRRDLSQLERFLEQGAGQPLATGTLNAEALINTAHSYLGVPHCMGGTTRRCMDCSGLLHTSFKTHGIDFPHSSEEQARYGTIISDRKQLRRGDLVFFIRSYNTSKFITHSGIYLGNDQFLHASSSQGVTITALSNSWWSERFIFGTRVL